MAKKIPSNFYQEVNVRKLNNVFDSGLPSIGSDDNGKVVKVVENKFALSEDLHTTVVANPEGSSTDELMTLKVGETIYAVNKPTFETIKALKITIENGGQYKTNKPIIEFYDDGGNKANITSSDYTVVCDKTYAGSANLEEVCSIDTPDTPGTFTYTFVNDFDTNKYHFLKLTRGGTFVNDIAKNIKVELSSDGENFLTLFDETSMTWSDAVTYHMYDIVTGEEGNTLLPIVTSADNGKVLGVVNGNWDKIMPTSKSTVLELTKSGNTYTLPITFNELFDLITNGIDVMVSFNYYINVPKSRIRARIISLNTDTSSRYVEFATTQLTDASNKIISIYTLNFQSNTTNLSKVDIKSAT